MSGVSGVSEIVETNNGNDASDIQSVVLTSLGNINGAIGAGSFIVNDYLISISDDGDTYTLTITKGSQTQTAVIRNAINIASIEQTVVSEEDHGLNTLRVTLTDGNHYDFNYYNGSQGSKGDPGLTAQEKQAIEDAESARVSAETIRGQNEGVRVSAENNRILYETLRQGEEAERVQQEKNRISGETSREQAEANRVAAEISRVYAEGQRNSNEQQRITDWTSLKNSVNAAIGSIVDLREDVETLGGYVEGATADVLEAYVNVNKEIEKAEGILQSVSVAVEQIAGITATATTLSPGSNATAEYDNGIIRLGIPKGVTGDAFHIVKTYASISAMNADFDNPEVLEGDFVIVVSTVEDPDNAKVYVKGEEQYVFIVDMSGATGLQGEQGVQGEPGLTPEVSMRLNENGVLQYLVIYSNGY